MKNAKETNIPLAPIPNIIYLMSDSREGLIEVEPTPSNVSDDNEVKYEHVVTLKL